jgi:hypothetical protein
MEKTDRPKILEYAIIRLGVPLAIVAIGVDLMRGEHSYYGVALFYLGLVLFALDVAYEKFFKRLHLSARIGIGFVFVLAILASLMWIFSPAPFEVIATSNVPTYGPGSKIHGIDWQPYYSDLLFSIKNQEAFDYDNFDMEISTNLAIGDLRQLRGLSDCKIATGHQAIEFNWQKMNGNQPVGPANNPDVSYAVGNLDKNGKLIIPVSGSDWSYRIRCDNIPANSQFDFFAALEVVNEPTPNMQLLSLAYYS